MRNNTQEQYITIVPNVARLGTKQTRQKDTATKEIHIKRYTELNKQIRRKL